MDRGCSKSGGAETVGGRESGLAEVEMGVAGNAGRQSGQRLKCRLISPRRTCLFGEKEGDNCSQYLSESQNRW